MPSVGLAACLPLPSALATNARARTPTAVSNSGVPGRRSSAATSSRIALASAVLAWRDEMRARLMKSLRAAMRAVSVCTGAAVDCGAALALKRRAASCTVASCPNRSATCSSGMSATNGEPMGSSRRWPGCTCCSMPVPNAGREAFCGLTHVCACAAGCTLPSTLMFGPTGCTVPSGAAYRVSGDGRARVGALGAGSASGAASASAGLISTPAAVWASTNAASRLSRFSEGRRTLSAPMPPPRMLPMMPPMVALVAVPSSTGRSPAGLGSIRS
ncbi:hypothetical protein D3C78_828340 [compost metagenome]